MTYSIYDPITGIIVSRVNDPGQILDRPHITGDYTPGEYQVVDHQVIPLPKAPAGPIQAVWLWDKAAQTYVIDIMRTERSARRIRQELLAAVDKVNPMWWAAMTSEQQALTAAYRQALLDITDQPGFPETIDWPTKPAWL